MTLINRDNISDYSSGLIKTKKKAELVDENKPRPPSILEFGMMYWFICNGSPA